MKTNSQTRLLRAHFWASCAIMFGVGYMVLSQIKYGILVAMACALCGATAKVVIQLRLDRLYREVQQASVDGTP